MEIRTKVYSPLQNTALWLGAWIYQLVPTETTVESLVELGGPHSFADGGLLDFLREFKNTAQPLIDAASNQPILSLTLISPAQVAALPAGSAAAQATAAGSDGALILTGVDKLDAHALIPTRDATSTHWDWIHITEELPAQSYLSPGEADEFLREATAAAAQVIADSAYSSLAPNSLKDPRLKVGTLSDFYEVPGLPDVTPSRSVKLIARANRVAAIIESVQGVIGDHSLDAQLIPLWRHVQSARITAVNYAMAEFARG